MSKENNTSRVPSPKQPLRTIRQQLIWSSIPIGVLILLAVGIVIWQVNRLAGAVGVLQVARERAIAALEVRQDSTQLIATINRLLPVEDAATFETDVSAALEALRESHAYLAVYTVEAERDESLYPLLDLVNSHIDSVIGIGETMVRQAHAEQWPSVRVRVGVLVRDQQQLSNDMSRLVALTRKVEEAANAQVVSAQQGAVFYPALVVALTLTLAALLVWRTIHSITRPIATLTEAATAIAKGDFKRTVVIEAGTEIDLLARAFNAMTKRLRDLIDTLEDRVQERTQALRDSEEQFRALSEAAFESIFLSEKGICVGQNLAAEKMFGYTLSEAVGRPGIEWIAPENREMVMNNMLSGYEEAYEATALRKDGLTFPAEIRGKMMRYQGREVRVTELRDITKRVQAEEALRESEEKFRNLAKKSPNIIFINQRGTIVYANEICEEIMGYTQEEFYAPDFEFLNLIAPESVKIVKENYRRHMQGQEVPSYEYQLLTKDGRRLDVIHTTRLITYEGEPAILGIITDITERKQMEGRLERLNRLKEDLLSPHGLDKKLKLITNAVVTIFEADFARIWLTKPGDLCDVDCIHAKVAQGPHICRYRDRCLHLVASSGRYTHIDGKLHRRVPFGCYKIGRVAAGENPKFITNDVTHDPRVHDLNWARELGLVSFAGYRLLSAAGESIGVLALFSKHAISLDEDALLEGLANTIAQVIQTARAEESLRESNRHLEDTLAQLVAAQGQILQQERLAAVGQLAAGIAHDFNNILTSILGFAELLRMSPDTLEPARLDLGRIVAQSQRAARLVRQILDFSRKSIRRPQQLDLVLFFEETFHFLKRTIPENIYLNLEAEPDECLVDADSTQFQQVLTNLAVNARDAMPEGGTLSLRLSCFNLKPGESPPYPELSPGEWVLFSVSDTGTGIPAEVLPHIFEPFFTTKEVGQGTGLGLAQVYGIIRQHEGYIDVASQAGQGTTFTIYLPAMVAKEKTATAEITTDIPRGHGETVLLVEDEPTVLATGQAMLEYLGYRVLTAVNGQEALAVYAKYKTEIALVITDMVMPELDGAALFQALQIQNPEIKVLLTTGYPLGEEALKVMVQGREEWLQKPLTMAQLAQVVSQALQ